jgi:hypothetical protein
LTIERLTKYFYLNHQQLLHFRFELALFKIMSEYSYRIFPDIQDVDVKDTAKFYPKQTIELIKQ